MPEIATLHICTFPFTTIAPALAMTEKDTISAPALAMTGKGKTAAPALAMTGKGQAFTSQR